MTFREKITNMQNAIGYSGKKHDTITQTYEGSRAGMTSLREYMDPMVEWACDQNIDFSEEQEMRVEKTIRELLANSARASNYFTNKTVYLHVHMGQRGIVAHVQDEGQGFDHKTQLANLTAIEKPEEPDLLLGLEEGGTGLFSLIQFPEEFAYNTLGNAVVARFNFIE